MAKHKCPQCKLRFDYEMHGWICPGCGKVITDGDEKTVRAQESLEASLNQQKKASGRPAAARSVNQPRSTPSRPAASWSGSSIIGKVLYRLICTGLLVLVLILGLGIALMAPEMIESIRKNSDVEVPSVMAAEMNEDLCAGEYVIRITEVFVPEWEELSVPENGEYLAVRYETRGEDEEDPLGDPSDITWASLYDKTSCTYLLPLFATDLTEDDEVYSKLYDMGVSHDLSYEKGILVFLVQEPADSYDLYLVTGEENGYGMTDVLADICYTIPLTLTEEGEGAAS